MSAQSAQRATPIASAAALVATGSRRGRPAGETAMARHAYELYATLPARRRSYSALADALREEQRYLAGNKTLIRRIERWAARYGWQARVRARDQARAAAEQTRLDAALVAMSIRQAEAAAALREMVEQRLYALLRLDGMKIVAAREAQRLIAAGKPVPVQVKRMMAFPPLPLAVNAATLAQMWRNLVHIERRARGDAVMQMATAQRQAISIQIIAAAASDAVAASAAAWRR